MVTRTAGPRVTLAFLVLLCLSGCSQQRPEQGISGSNAHWSSGAADRVPGIEEGSTAFITLKAGPPSGVPFVIWCDRMIGVSGSGGGSAPGASYEGRFQVAPGKAWEGRTRCNDYLRNLSLEPCG
jgi:hypothetical protein